MSIVTGTLTSATTGTAKDFDTKVTVSIQGVVAGSVIAIQISFDSGANWETVNEFTDNTVQILNLLRRELYQVRVNCTTYVSGTIRYSLL